MFHLTMFILPPVLAWIIHIFLRSAQLNGRKKAAFFLFYLYEKRRRAG